MNKFDGKGTFMNKRGKYVGAWQGGKKHGYGVMTWYKGMKYEGQWVNGFMHGVSR